MVETWFYSTVLLLGHYPQKGQILKIEFDIAISFAGEDRVVAEQFAELWSKTYSLRVFYDTYEQAKLLGEKLIPYLHEIYSEKSLYCVVIISKDYKRKRWTSVEFEGAQERAFNEFEQAYILPIRIDDTKLPGFPSTRGHLDIRKIEISKIAAIIFDKVKYRVEKQNKLREAERLFNQGDFDRTIAILDGIETKGDFDSLIVKADALHRIGDYEKAIVTYEKAVEIRDDEFLPFFYWVSRAFALKNLTRLLNIMQKHMKLTPRT